MDERRRRLGIGPVLVTVAGLALVALLTFGLVSRAPDTSIDEALRDGRSTTAPAFTLALLEPGRELARLEAPVRRAGADRRLGIRELRGTPVVLNFWASWCEPCRDEAPLLERAWREQARPAGVLMLGLAMLDTTTDAKDFLREFTITYPNVRDGTNGVARRYGVPALPETFFITARGEIVGHVIGVISPAQLRDGITAAQTGRILGARDGGDSRPTP